MKHLLLSATVCCLCIFSAHAQSGQPFELKARQAFTIACDKNEAEVVHTALQILVQDCQSVLNVQPRVTSSTKDARIFVGTLDKHQSLFKKQIDFTAIDGKHEAFLITVVPGKGAPCLVITGSDKRGTAYGVMELSRMLGVSPWEWWADVHPATQESFRLEAGYQNTQAPTVEYRGIFLNDEDWGLTPWSWQTYEPSDVKGQIGPRTHARIFELLLRLRANTFWPAMHECSVPFYVTPGNKEVADKYGILVGSSHCEPLNRNTNGEWKLDGKGVYDYVHNRQAVLDFWEQRVKELANSDNFNTLGIRGVHDSKMLGANTIDEQKAAIADVLKDQRALLAKYHHTDITRIPQVFIPYKEVLDVYNAGLQVPDDVTLMWCDDNYGYIRHFPTPEEQARKGGNGVYYHMSYWGRPHDYLWLASTNPALVYTQMKMAYDRGVRKLWILNVGDIKPAEYLTEFFLDMAWDIKMVEKEGVQTHLTNWLTREFGASAATALTPAMQEYYRLAHIRKPEFMGNTRVEEQDPAYKQITDLPWSEQTIRQRLADYEKISATTEAVAAQIPANRRDAYFQLVKYPVQGATQMNKKWLTAQLARHGKAGWEESAAAYDSITALTHTYTTQCDGKWYRMMDAAPRELPVFQQAQPSIVNEPMVTDRTAMAHFNGTGYSKVLNGAPVACVGLGYQGKAVAIPQGTSIEFSFEAPATGAVDVELRLLPNHPMNDRQQLRYSISVDGEQPQVVDFHTEGRSEEWKLNVLRNQAIRSTVHQLRGAGKHKIVVTALDEGVILDEMGVFEPVSM